MNIPDDLSYSEFSNNEWVFVWQITLMAVVTTTLAVLGGHELGKLFGAGYERLTGVFIVAAWWWSFWYVHKKTS